MRVTAPLTPIPTGTDATPTSTSFPVTSSPPPADVMAQTTQNSTPVSSLPTSTPPLIQSTSTSSIASLKREPSDIIDDNPSKRQRLDESTSHLQPPSSTSTTSPSKVKKKKRPLSPQDPNAPPRRTGTKQPKLKKPLAPFHLYAHAIRALGSIKDENGNIVTDEKAATKVISTRWKALSRADKQVYKTQYDQEMITYTEALKKQEEEAVAAFQSGKSTPGAVAAGKEALAQYLSSKAENAETTSTRTLLPLSAVRKLLQNDPSLAPLSREAASVVTRCGEEFARWMSRRIFECAWLGGRKILRMQDFELALASQECLRFARHTMFARPPGAAHDKPYEEEFPDDEMVVDEGEDATRATPVPSTIGTATGIEPGEVIINDTARTHAEAEAEAEADADAAEVDAMEDDGERDAELAVDPDAEGDGDQDGGDGDGDGDGDDGDEPEGGEESAAAAAGDGGASPPSNTATAAEPAAAAAPTVP